jgi:hypothetical protein
MSIGIGITTHNRSTLSKTLQMCKRFTPSAKIVVVDDASTLQVVSDFRFNENVGIAKAKNKCLELLEDCEHIFLFDDDTYPIIKGWERYYIEAYEKTGNAHLCFTFDHLKGGTKNGNIKQGIVNGLNYFNNPCGCMMFINKEVLKCVGGFSSQYLRYGYEHLGWSWRIHNAGFTFKPFLDVPNSLNLFYSLDYHRQIETSVGLGNKGQYTKHNAAVYELEKKESNWKPYQKIKAVIGAYFDNISNPQGNKVGLYDVKKWIDSVTKLGYHAILLTNKIELENTDLFKNIWVDIDRNKSVYHNRFDKIIEWIKHNEYYLNEVWMTDTTDVEMLNVPAIKNKIYVGSENETNSCKWILEKSIEAKKKISDYTKFVKEDSTLLNCGVIGGNIQVLLPMLKEYQILLKQMNEPCSDMPLINYLGYKYGAEFGEHVTTRFKKNEYTKAWFKHK